VVPLASLLVPILLSAVVVFFASSIVHMVMPYHRKDFGKLADEDGAMDALRRFNIPPGDYLVPHPGGAAGMKEPAYQEKLKKGPVVIMSLRHGPSSMGQSLGLWFVYSLLIGLFAAYITSHALSTGASYLEVFRFVGTTAFMGYALALMQNSIWYWRNWRMTLTTMFDGLMYALLTAGVFGWLWPR